MLRLVLALFAFVTISGCAATMHYKSDFQETARENEYGEIYANLFRYQETSFFSTTIENRIELFIDDQLIVKSPLYRDFSGELYFFYQGMPVVVDCLQPNFYTAPECSVQINGRRSGKLTFKIR